MRLRMLTLLFFVPYLGQAQFIWPSAKKLEKLENRIILVQLQETQRSLMLRLNHAPDEQAYYKQEIEDKNTLLKNTIENYWTLNNEIQYKTRKEIQKLFEQAPERYAVFRMQWEPVYEYQGNDDDYQIEAFVVSLRIGPFQNNTIFSVSLPSEHIDAVDYQWLSKTFMEGLQNIETEKPSLNQQLFVDSICLTKADLIDKPWFDTKTVLSSYTTINELLASNPENMAYISVVWSEKFNQWSFILIHAETGEVIAHKGIPSTGFEGPSRRFIAETDDWGIYSYRSKLNLNQIPLKHFFSVLNPE